MRTIMDSATRKLYSRSGVSILFGLMFFLLSAMVGVVMLSAAATTAKRLADDAARQKDSLAVSSAAKLFTACLENAECYFYKTFEETTVTDTENDTETRTRTEPDISVAAEGTEISLKPLLDYALDQVINNPEGLSGTGGKYVVSMRLTADSFPGQAADSFPPVEVQNLTFYPITTDDEGKPTGDSFKIKAVFASSDSSSGIVQKIFLTATANLPPCVDKNPLWADADMSEHSRVTLNQYEEENVTTLEERVVFRSTRLTWTVELSTREASGA